jgi:DNA-binding NarL/FixJ family response regulator
MGVFCRSERKLDLLWKCISAVYQGQVWANSLQLRLLLKALQRQAHIRVVASTGQNLLTKRETEVAGLVVEGQPTKEIAAKLGITEHTVSNYLFRIYSKLGISTRVELVLCLMKQQEARVPTN